MGIFDEAEKAGEDMAKSNPDEIKSVMGDAESAADSATGNKFDSQIQAAGTQAEGSVDQL